MSDADAQLLLKKRARRRLVGAIAFVLFAAVVLPMVMDASPPLPAQEVQIRIPGQEQPIFTPPPAPAKSAAADAPATPAATPAAAPDTPPAPSVAAKPSPAAVAAVAAAPVVAAAVVAASDKMAAKTPESKSADKKPVDKPADKPVDKPAVTEKHADKPAEKAADKAKPADKKDEKDKKPDAKKGEGDRAAAILAGKPAAAAGAQVILIGAYANPGNVKVLRAKLDQIGVKTYTETLSSPQGNKTRLRAGPFANKEAAEKALEKMKRIGVGGVIAAK